MNVLLTIDKNGLLENAEFNDMADVLSAPVNMKNDHLIRNPNQPKDSGAFMPVTTPVDSSCADGIITITSTYIPPDGYYSLSITAELKDRAIARVPIGATGGYYTGSYRIEVTFLNDFIGGGMQVNGPNVGGTAGVILNINTDNTVGASVIFEANYASLNTYGILNVGDTRINAGIRTTLGVSGGCFAGYSDGYFKGEVIAPSPLGASHSIYFELVRR